MYSSIISNPGFERDNDLICQPVCVFVLERWESLKTNSICHSIKLAKYDGFECDSFLPKKRSLQILSSGDYLPVDVLLISLICRLVRCIIWKSYRIFVLNSLCFLLSGKYIFWKNHLDRLNCWLIEPRSDYIMLFCVCLSCCCCCCRSWISFTVFYHSFSKNE